MVEIEKMAQDEMGNLDITTARHVFLEEKKIKNQKKVK